MIADACVSCGHSTSPGSGRFVNRISASGDVELPDGTTEYRSGWGCALCYEECGYEDATGYVCHECADVDDLDDAGERGMDPVWADDIEGRAECHKCARVLHDWSGWEDGKPNR